MDHICVKLPLPVSVNKAYAGNWKRFKSREYLDWIEHANLIMNRYPRYSIEWDEWLRVEYDYEMPFFYKNWNKKIQDIFNYEKALSDFLSKRIPWFKDHKIIDGRVRKIDSNINYVTIRIYEKLDTK